MLTHFDLDVNRLTKGNGQNQVLKSSSIEVKVLTLAFYFSLFFCVYLYAHVFITCLFSLGLLCSCYRHVRLLVS